MRSLWRVLTPANLLSWPVFLVSFGITAAIHLTDARVVAAGIGWPRLVALVIAQVVLFIALAVGTLPLRYARGAVLPWGTLFVILCAAALRGWAFDAVLVALDGTAASAAGYFIATSLVFLGLILPLLTIVVGETRRRRTARAQLIADQESLRALARQTTQAAEVTDAEAVAVIQQRLLDAISPANAATEATVVLATLRAAVDDVVRPISRALETSSDQWQPPAVRQPSMPSDWAGALKAAFRPASMRPLLTATIGGVVVLPSAMLRIGVIAGLSIAATVFIVGAVTLLIARTIAVHVVRERSTAVNVSAFIVCLLFAGLITGFATHVPFAMTNSMSYLVVQVPIFFPVVGAVIATVAAVRAHSEAIDAELASTRDDLRWAIVRVRETQRQHQQALSRALHGRVQSTISACHLKLSRLAACGDVDAASVTAALADVNEAIAWLSTEITTPQTLNETVRKTQVTWSGMMTITADIDPSVAQRIDDDPIVSASLRDLLPELCFNATKHSSAEQIDIAISADGVRTMLLRVTNNGSAHIMQATTGQGERLLDGATLHWSRAQAGDRTVTEAWLPLP